MTKTADRTHQPEIIIDLITDDIKKQIREILEAQSQLEFPSDLDETIRATWIIESPQVNKVWCDIDKNAPAEEIDQKVEWIISNCKTRLRIESYSTSKAYMEHIRLFKEKN